VFFIVEDGMTKDCSPARDKYLKLFYLALLAFSVMWG
jgi:hypothetical protein